MAKDQSSANTLGERQIFYFQYITTPTADTPGTTLLLHFNNRRYFFGRIAEGLQRACIQRGLSIKKVRNLFLTGLTTWNSTGGLIGLILTMADVQYEEIDQTTGKRPTLRIQGGPKLTHSIACARRFVFRTGMPLEIHETDPKNAWSDTPSYVDDNVSVWSIPVSRRVHSGRSSPCLPFNRSQSPATLTREQALRAETVRNMFDSDWRKDRLVESRFDEVKLPALIWARNADTKELTCIQCTTMDDAPHLKPESKVMVRNPWPASLVEELPPADNITGSVAISYIVKGKPQRGKFLPQKAKELGVKPGPNFAILTAGASVTVDGGRIVTPEMVLGDTEPGKGMAVLDVPSDDYLEDLSSKLETLDQEMMTGIEAVSWLLGPGVVLSSIFAKLVASLPGLQHIVSSPDVGSDYLALGSAAASSIRLAQIRPDCFIVPVHNNANPMAALVPQNLGIIPAEPGLIVQVAPKLLINRSEVPSLLDIEATKAAYNNVLHDLLPPSTHSEDPVHAHDDVQILTLGTGSAVPSKYRNVSATLVRIPNLGSYLFDCGENTLGMLRRAYSSTQLDEILADLRMIWISHLHADHHLGTLSIIEAKRRVMERLGRTEPRLYIIGEPNMADYLNDYSSVQSSTHCELLGVLNSKFMTKDRHSPPTTISISKTSLPIDDFRTTKVSHCHGAQACSITFNNGFKFSYSGDCRPSAQFAKIGQDSDVLLHEATFDDGLEGDAKAKKHSTTGEALAVAHAMKAKNVILTHFSQRYQKIPVLKNVQFGEVKFEESTETEDVGPIESNEAFQSLERTSVENTTLPTTGEPSTKSDAESIATLQKIAREMNICVAFDLMSVTLRQIRDMHSYYPAIERMFELENDKSEAIRDQRREANERMKEEKDMRENKWKGKATKSKPSESKTDDIYERINRNKAKGSKDNHESAMLFGADEAVETSSTGASKYETLDSNSTSHSSNRARKRQLRKQQKVQSSTDLPNISVVDNSTLTTGKVEEQAALQSSSFEPVENESKRIKLDNGSQTANRES